MSIVMLIWDGTFYPYQTPPLMDTFCNIIHLYPIQCTQGRQGHDLFNCGLPPPPFLATRFWPFSNHETCLFWKEDSIKLNLKPKFANVSTDHGTPKSSCLLDSDALCSISGRVRVLDWQNFGDETASGRRQWRWSTARLRLCTTGLGRGSLGFWIYKENKTWVS